MMLAYSRLKEVLNYDPDTGLFRWRKAHQKVRSGDIAGCVDAGGYVRIRVDGRKYRAHRLAWLFVTGEWPTQIDHKDLNKANNAFANLREASDSQNNGNRQRQRNNTSGYRGVYWFKPRKRWVAYLSNNRLGSFRTREEAAAVYAAAAKAYFGEFARMQ